MSEESIRTYLGTVERQLAADGCGPRWEQWGGSPVLIGRRADFRMRWAATKLHLFTVATAVPEITVQTVEGFTAQALRYAKTNKGGLPVGFQTGLAVFPVLVSDRVDPAAMAWAEEKQRNQFGCFARPVVVDAANGYAGYYQGKPMVGLAYAAHLIEKGNLYFRSAPVA
ncbi:levansucrase [Streptomyces sp. NPDC012600]|uniref:levansucrase n=1 Tax=Streptomyces sp. NPDC012600 TaxID=3415005 RepID=UPI003C2C1D4D